MSRISQLFQKFRPASEDQKSQSDRINVRWLIVGLGNPGEQYQRSRHNVGFMTIERLALRHHAKLTRRKFNGLYGEITTEADGAMLGVPLTFYNRSGEFVQGMLGYFKTPVDHLIVIHDDMDLAPLQIRVKRGGGDAGNRGVRSIIESLGNRDFIRVRIGIGHPNGDFDSINHVLKPLSANELDDYVPVFDRAGDAVLAIIRDGLERAMNVYNQKG